MKRKPPKRVPAVFGGPVFGRGPVNVKGSDGGPLPADKRDAFRVVKHLCQCGNEWLSISHTRCEACGRLRPSYSVGYQQGATDAVAAAFERCAVYADAGINIEFARTMSENDGTKACRQLAKIFREHASNATSGNE